MSDNQQNPSRPDAPVAPSCDGHAGAARLPLLIDSHCHPHFPQLGDAAEITAEMRAGGIAGALIVATSRAEVPVVREWTREYPGVFHAALGLHPLGEDSADADEIAEWCADEEVLAVGETGLDFFRGRETEARQRELFSAHIEAAKRVGKPLVIHTRDSADATLAALKAEGADSVGGVLHCFTGDIRQARLGLEINFIVSFSGVLTFKNAENIRVVARWAPADGYMVETDAPYLAPVPYRGKVNRPAYVRETARALALARETDEETVARETTENFNRLFRPAGKAQA